MLSQKFAVLSSKMAENLWIELANKILAEGVVDSSWNLHNFNYFCL